MNKMSVTEEEIQVAEELGEACADMIEDLVDIAENRGLNLHEALVQSSLALIETGLATIRTIRTDDASSAMSFELVTQYMKELWETWELQEEEDEEDCEGCS